MPSKMTKAFVLTPEHYEIIKKKAERDGEDNMSAALRMILVEWAITHGDDRPAVMTQPQATA